MVIRNGISIFRKHILHSISCRGDAPGGGGEESCLPCFLAASACYSGKQDAGLLSDPAGLALGSLHNKYYELPMLSIILLTNPCCVVLGGLSFLSLQLGCSHIRCFGTFSCLYLVIKASLPLGFLPR